MTENNMGALSAYHRKELLELSSIDPNVATERGYVTVGRPASALRDGLGRDTRQQLSAMGFPGWAIQEDGYFPGLHIPQYTPGGQRYAGQWKPAHAVTNRAGRRQRYTAAKGAARLDVHPRWSVLGGELVPPIRDVTRRLWITEGVKKADSLTSRGEVTIALTGVYNWRNTHGTLGDWEDVALRGREIVLCFDADATSKPAVAEAMGRLGKWLKHKGAAKVWYLVCPGPQKGVDDFLAAGGTMLQLEQGFSSKAPDVANLDDRFTDARLADVLAVEVLEGSYVWAQGLGWMRFNGHVWREATEVTVHETVRQWSLERFGEAAARLRLDDRSAAAEVDGWRGMLSRNRATTVTAGARGPVEHDASEFDADADHLNVANGYLRLDTGEVRQVGADEYPTKITGAAFQPDASSPVWDAFLERILPDADVRAFVQRLIGYSLLGEVREHVMPIFTGEGANGKGTLRDAIMAALGDYALEVDPELLMSTANPRHLTFLMELRGRRLVFCSETEKGRRFAESTMKRLVGGDPIQANRMRMDPITFQPSHTLVMCTNHLPQVSGDDPAVWRRILVVPFDVVIPPEERDGRLPARLGEPDVSAAVLAWAYRGYAAYRDGGLAAPPQVLARTEAYQADSDLTGRFLEECTERSGAARSTLKELGEAYQAWFRGEAGRDDVPLSNRELSKELTRRGWESVKSNGQAVFRGLHLSTAETP